MARKSKKQLESEAASVEPAAEEESSSRTEIIDDSAELVDPTPHTARRRPTAKTQVPRPTEAELKAAAPKRYLVKRGGRILARGNITMLKSGKIIKAGGYNIEQLKQQGIVLDELPD